MVCFRFHSCTYMKSDKGEGRRSPGCGLFWELRFSTVWSFFITWSFLGFRGKIAIFEENLRKMKIFQNISPGSGFSLFGHNALAFSQLLRTNISMSKARYWEPSHLYSSSISIRSRFFSLFSLSLSSRREAYFLSTGIPWALTDEEAELPDADLLSVEPRYKTPHMHIHTKLEGGRTKSNKPSRLDNRVTVQKSLLRWKFRQSKHPQLSSWSIFAIWKCFSLGTRPAALGASHCIHRNAIAETIEPPYENWILFRSRTHVNYYRNDGIIIGG